MVEDVTYIIQYVTISLIPLINLGVEGGSAGQPPTGLCCLASHMQNWPIWSYHVTMTKECINILNWQCSSQTFNWTISLLNYQKIVNITSQCRQKDKYDPKFFLIRQIYLNKFEKKKSLFKDINFNLKKNKKNIGKK